MKTLSDVAQFLESLKPVKEGPEEMHGWRFDESLDDAFGKTNVWGEQLRGPKYFEYLKERCRRAEANAKSPGLLEDVKACMRAAMDCSQNAVISPAAYEKAAQFWKLCEASK